MENNTDENIENLHTESATCQHASQTFPATPATPASRCLALPRAASRYLALHHATSRCITLHHAAVWVLVE
jgi:hypothetical protein